MMDIKWIGAALVILGCGGVGWGLSAAHRFQEQNLQQLIYALDYMQCELQYRLTPLPDLCRQTGAQCRGSLRCFFLKLAEQMEDQLSPDAWRCVESALGHVPDLPTRTQEALTLLGRTLGRFDLDGQLNGLEQTRNHCRKVMDELSANRDNRLRSYQTLGLCAGAALAIIFL